MIPGCYLTQVYLLIQEDWRGEIHQLSWSPRAFLLKGFLTPEECDHLIGLAEPYMEKSEVADEESGKSVTSDVRTSTGMFLESAQDEVVAAVERRVAQVCLHLTRPKMHPAKAINVFHVLCWSRPGAAASQAMHGPGGCGQQHARQQGNRECRQSGAHWQGAVGYLPLRIFLTQEI